MDLREKEKVPAVFRLVKILQADFWLAENSWLPVDVNYGHDVIFWAR